MSVLFYRETYRPSAGPATSVHIIVDDFFDFLNKCTFYGNLYIATSLGDGQLGPLRGGTIEFALCAVEGKTKKEITAAKQTTNFCLCLELHFSWA
jgi:hypothetical protein